MHGEPHLTQGDKVQLAVGGDSRHKAPQSLLHGVEIEPAEDVDALQRQIERARVHEADGEMVRGVRVRGMAQQRHVRLGGGRLLLVRRRRRRRVLALYAALYAGPVVGVALLLVLEPQRAVVDAEHARRLAEADAADAHRLERALEVLLRLRVGGAAALGRRGGRRLGQRRGGRHAARPRRPAVHLPLHVRPRAPASAAASAAVHHAAHVHAAAALAPQRSSEARVRIPRVRVLHHTPLTSWEERLMVFFIKVHKLLSGRALYENAAPDLIITRFIDLPSLKSKGPERATLAAQSDNIKGRSYARLNFAY